MKVARFLVNISILYGQKQLIKIGSFTISQMCLYLIPPFPKVFEALICWFWSVLNIKRTYRHFYRVNTKITNWWHFRAKQGNCLFLQCSITELTFHAPSYCLAEHWHSIVYNCKDTYLCEFKSGLHKRNKKTLYTTNCF